MARVSVILPFRDSKATLVSAVESVLAQGFRDLELIAVDDGSMDGSGGELGRIRDRRLIRLSNKSRPGVAGALSSGIDAASGEWIARMDADDRSHPDRLESQIAAADEGVDVVACGVRATGAAGPGMRRYVDWANALLDHESMARERFVESPVVHPSVMIRRRSLDGVGGYREVAWAEDHDLWLRMFEAGCRFRKLDKVLLDWRDAPDRLTRRDPCYGGAARTAMRAHFLARMPTVREKGVIIAGAGPIGKSLALALLWEGVEVRGFLEVSKRRIGQIIHGAQVADAAEADRFHRDAVLLGAVGLPGGREKVRELARGSGRVEGRDFWCVC